MVMTAVRLHQTKHPDEAAAKAYDGLIGIEAQKATLTDHLLGVLDPDRVARWEKKQPPPGAVPGPPLGGPAAARDPRGRGRLR
jgi:hypothetical protein